MTFEFKQEKAECIHHWDLGAVHGGIIHGKCRKCGAEKDFSSTPTSSYAIGQGKKKAAQPPIDPVR